MKEETKNSYINVDTLKNMYKTLKEEYQKKFVDLYGFNMHDSYWTGNVLTVADYFIDFYNVVYAVDNDVCEYDLFNWYDYDLTLGEFSLGNVNLESYMKGIRPYNEKEIRELSELHSKLNKAQSDFEDMLFKLQNSKKA